jgi:opacity protein-like surface antigen
MWINDWDAISYNFTGVAGGMSDGQRFLLKRVDGPLSPRIIDRPLNFTGVYQEQYRLTISTTEGGITGPAADIYWYSAGTPLTATAYAYPGYVFSQWILDYQPAGSNTTIAITMDQEHVLQAEFSPAPPP